MHYQGRSPINDVVRSVVMGAAMISPAVLAGCSGSSASSAPPPTPLTLPTPPLDPNANMATDDAGAPPNNIVRPRTPDGPTNTMPTRGFSGAAPRRGSRPT